MFLEQILSLEPRFTRRQNFIIVQSESILMGECNTILYSEQALNPLPDDKF